MTDLLNIPILAGEKQESIENLIYEIRGKQVMLDSDIAFFFETETGNLNKQMKRNKNRFPEEFCFQLNSKEFKNLRFQNAISSYGGRRYLPYAYTEHGIIALAGVLKSEVAARMSVEITKKFVQMRNFIMENGDTLLKLAQLQNRQINFEIETNKRFDEVLRAINKCDLPKQAAFYDGEYYDAYELICSFIRKATLSIVVIDPYCDNKVLSFLKNRNSGVSITIYGSSKSKLTTDDIAIYLEQYSGDFFLKYNETFHDRFLIIDSVECYSLETSFNYMGKKTFAINKIEDEGVIKKIIDRVDSE